MRSLKFWGPFTALVFVVGLVAGSLIHGTGMVSAQSDPAAGISLEASINVLSSTIPVQGRLTTAAGAPINDDIIMTFKLYDSAVGGTALCTDTHWVAVEHGLFSTIVGDCSQEIYNGQLLYLGISVSSDSEMSPRQIILPVPYALSLVPAAIISNTSGGRGLQVFSNQIGIGGTALWVENTDKETGGIGLWSVVKGDDASIIASNDGSGPLFKGFGSDGGEDEFRVNNDGAIETKADSYFFIPAILLVKQNHQDTLYWDSTYYGGVIIRSGATDGGNMDVVIPITIPAQFYGQPVKVKNIWMTYKVTSPSGLTYISGATLFRETDPLNYDYLFSDPTDLKSSTPVMHPFPALTNNILDANRGGMALLLKLTFDNGTDSITIGSIRIQLGHHDLY